MSTNDSLDSFSQVFDNEHLLKFFYRLVRVINELKCDNRSPLHFRAYRNALSYIMESPKRLIDLLENNYDEERYDDAAVALVFTMYQLCIEEDHNERT